MNYKKLLRYKPWLRLVNNNNISTRLLESTEGNVFIVYNTIKHSYELHTIEAYNLSGDSYNTSIDIEFLNGFIYYDYRANDYKKFMNDIISERMKRDMRYDKMEETRHDTKQMLKAIERTLGVKI